jgi:hypothetical protein
VFQVVVCVLGAVQLAFVGKKNFDVIKMRGTTIKTTNFMFEFPCIISLYYMKNQQDATLAVLFISNCKITLHVLDAFCAHNREYQKL